MSSFFTCAGLARFALRKGHLGLWNAALVLGGEVNLVPAEQLANAAASPHRKGWERVSVVFADTLNIPDAVLRALYRSVEQDNLLLLQDLYGRARELKCAIDGNFLLMRIARHGANSCWMFAVDEMKLHPSADIYDSLVDAAILGQSEMILGFLQSALYLPQEMRARIRSKMLLDYELGGRNTNYILSVLSRCVWLKSSDYAEALAFAMRIKSGYMRDVVYKYMDEADGRWAKYNRKLLHSKVVHDILERAA